MAVSRPPWSSPPKTRVTAPTPDEIRQAVSPFSENKEALDKAVVSLTKRILQLPNEYVSEEQKRKNIQTVIDIAYKGKEAPGRSGGLLGAARQVGKAFSQGPILWKAGKYALEASAQVSRGIQSLAVEASDVINRPLLQGAGQIGLAPKDAYKRYQVSAGDLWKQYTDENWGAYKEGSQYQTGNKWIDKPLDFITSVASDPITYTGVGATANIGRSGRAAWATWALQDDVLRKYPQLEGLSNEILRRGVTAMPREVLEAEGIKTGLRFAGRVIPETEVVEQVFARTGGALRARIGDLVYSSGKAGAVGRALTGKAMRPVVRAGGGRLKGVDEAKVAQELKVWTATKRMKGATAVAARTFQAEIIDLANEQRALAGKSLRGRTPNAVYDPEAANLYRYVEMSDSDLAAAPITQELKDLATRVKDWQNRVRTNANQQIRKFGEDYDVVASQREVGFLDDYIHHKLTSKARAWMLSESGEQALRRGGFFSADVQKKDLVNPGGPLMFRQYRAPWTNPTTGEVVSSKFLGQEVREGTIDEMNRIFRRVTGSDFDFFETDFIQIADSYAQSMSKVVGRVAFVRRMMDFRDSGIIKEIIRETVPDSALVARLEKTLQATMRMRGMLVTRMERRAGRIVGYGKESADFAQKFLRGQLRKMDLTEREVGRLINDIDNATIELAQSVAEAATKTAQARGDFEIVHQSLVREIADMRAAVEDPDYYAAHQMLKEAYQRLYPKASAASVDRLSPEQLAEKVLQANKVRYSREQRVVERRINEIRKQIDQIPDGEQYAQARQALEDALGQVERDSFALDLVADARVRATYSDGFLYGSEDAVRAGSPDGDLKVLRSVPLQEGYWDDATSVAVRAIPEEELLDLRKADDMFELLAGTTTENGVAGYTGLYLARSGRAELGQVLQRQADEFFQTGEFSEGFEQVYPEAAEFLRNLRGYAEAVGDGEVDYDLMGEILVSLEDGLRAVYSSSGILESEELARKTLLEAMGQMAIRDRDAAGVIVPQTWLDDLLDDDEMADAFAVLLRPEWRGAEPSVLADAPVQRVADNPFIQTFADNGFDDSTDALRAARQKRHEEIVELEVNQLARPDLVREVDQLSKVSDDVARDMNRAVDEAEQARQTLRDKDHIEVTVKGVTRKVTRTQAQSALAKADRRLAGAYDALAKKEQRIIDASGQERIRAKILGYEERLPMALNEVAVLRGWSEQVATVLRDDIDTLRTIIRQRPPKGAAAGENASWLRKVDAAMRSVDMIEDPATRQAYERVVTLLHADEAQLAFLDNILIPDQIADLAATKSGWNGDLVNKTLEGWEEIAGLGVQMPSEILDIWKPNLLKLQSKSEWNSFLRAYDYTVNFFKVYATSTVGFFVRNGMSASFMNWVAGVDAANTILGVKAARAIAKGPDEWAKFVSKQDSGMQVILEEAYRATEATGRGTVDLLSGVGLRGKKGEKVINNAYTRFFQRKNELVERAVRMPMAIDSLVKGRTWDEAVVRINRYHFDYSDLSKVDEMARKLIPFWIWTSRNVPLQITEQFMNPGAYSVYEKVKDTSPVGDQIFMPRWIDEWDPMALGGPDAQGGQWVLTPDFPIVRMEQQIEQLTNPRKLIGQMAPIIKLPLEFMMGRQAGIDVGPFKDKKYPAKGLDKVLWGRIAEVLAGEGLVQYDPKTGEMLLDERVPYLVQNILPTLGQINRVTGGAVGGRPSRSYAERQLGNIMNWAGIPVRYVGPEQQASEAYGRTRTLGELAKVLQGRGQILSSKDSKKLEKALREIKKLDSKKKP